MADGGYSVGDPVWYVFCSGGGHNSTLNLLYQLSIFWYVNKHILNRFLLRFRLFLYSRQMWRARFILNISCYFVLGLLFVLFKYKKEM